MQKAQDFIRKRLERKQNKVFDASKVLYFSMASFAEIYLSNNIVFMAKSSIMKAKNKSGKLLKKTRKNLTRLISKPSGGIDALLDSNVSQQEMSEGAEIAKIIKNNAFKALKYSSKTKKIPAKSALKIFYSISFNYGNTGYGAGRKEYNAIRKNTQKVVGFVKYSMEKYIKVFQFVLAIAMPQWNMPWGSKNDYDTLANTVSPNASVDEENLRYNFAHSSLRYRLS